MEPFRISVGNSYEKDVVFSRESEAAELMQGFFRGDRDVAAGIPLFIIHGAGNAGITSVVGVSLPARLGRFHLRAVTPTVVRLSAAEFFRTVEDPVAACIRLIVGKHPLLESDSIDSDELAQLLTLAERHPPDAGKKIRQLLNREDTVSGRKIGPGSVRLIVQFEDVERLFEKDAHGFEESKEGAGMRDLLGFLHGLRGQRSVFFSFSCQSWVSDQLVGMAAHAGMNSDDLFLFEVDHPDLNSLTRFVKGHLIESLKERGSSISLTESHHALIEVIAEGMQLYPGCIQLIPLLISRLWEEADALDKPLCVLDYNGIEKLGGFFCEYLDSTLGSLPEDELSCVTNLFLKMSKEKAFSIPFREAEISVKISNAARILNEAGIFAIEGESFADAKFVPSHPALYSKWEGWPESGLGDRAEEELFQNSRQTQTDPPELESVADARKVPVIAWAAILLFMIAAAVFFVKGGSRVVLEDRLIDMAAGKKTLESPKAEEPKKTSSPKAPSAENTAKSEAPDFNTTNAAKPDLAQAAAAGSSVPLPSAPVAETRHLQQWN